MNDGGVTLYLYGCQSCGINATYIRGCKSKCAREGIPFRVKNSKYDQQSRIEHSEYLMNNAIKTDKYPALVVYNDIVTTPREWLL